MLAALLVVACDREPADLPIATDVQAGAVDVPTDTPRPTPTRRSLEYYESLSATAIAQADFQPNPNPAPRRIPGETCPEYEPELYINRLAFVGLNPREEIDHYLYWTPDGEQLVFNENYTNIRAVDADGSEIRTIVNIYPSKFLPTPPYSLHLDLSQDGSRIVYSSCEFDILGPVAQKSGSIQSMVLTDSFGRDGSWYELASIGIDGTSLRRLTDNEHMDHYPAWSPDGTRIAFIEEPEYDFILSIIPADGSGKATRLTTGDDLHVQLLPPVWSPDGELLAFFAEEWDEYGLSNVIHTLRHDGSDLTRIGFSMVLPVWSADSGELIFARTEELDGSPGMWEATIYSVRPDGTRMQEVWSSAPRPYELYGLDQRFPRVLQLALYPDGSELLFLYYEETHGNDDDYFGLYIVNADGSGLRRLASFETFVRAEWSPDGSRIAVLDLANGDEDVSLITMTPATGDVRLLAGADGTRYTHNFEDGRFQVLSTPGLDVSVDVSACAEGLVVPEPEAHPGLVQDCETLLTVRDALAGEADLDWSGQSAMEEWEGVTIECCPSRVSELSLADRGLTGVIPPEIGQLASLVSLDLSSNRLSGAIPPEIGQLAELESLDLTRNWLTGAIPPGFDGLRSLKLGRNYLSGSIPRELGSDGMLEELHLNNNYLTGSIPGELGSHSHLEKLYIQSNNLSGSIPAELGSLSGLSYFDLSNNWLEGPIPPELGDLDWKWLSYARLYNTQIEGCIPAEMWDRRRWEDRDRFELQRCDGADS